MKGGRARGEVRLLEATNFLHWKVERALLSSV